MGAPRAGVRHSRGAAGRPIFAGEMLPAPSLEEQANIAETLQPPALVRSTRGRSSARASSASRSPSPSRSSGGARPPGSFASCRRSSACSSSRSRRGSASTRRSASRCRRSSRSCRCCSRCPCALVPIAVVLAGDARALPGRAQRRDARQPARARDPQRLVRDRPGRRLRARARRAPTRPRRGPADRPRSPPSSSSTSSLPALRYAIVARRHARRARCASSWV